MLGPEIALMREKGEKKKKKLPLELTKRREEWKKEKKREKGKNLEGISSKEGEKTVIKKRIRVKKELQQKIKIKRGERREKK